MVADMQIILERVNNNPSFSVWRRISQNLELIAEHQFFTASLSFSQCVRRHANNRALSDYVSYGWAPSRFSFDQSPWDNQECKAGRQPVGRNERAHKFQQSKKREKLEKLQDTNGRTARIAIQHSVVQLQLELIYSSESDNRGLFQAKSHGSCPEYDTNQYFH